MVEQKIKETTAQISHILHCEAIHIKAPAVQIFHIILLHGGFQMSKHGFFDVCFDLSFKQYETHKVALTNNMTDERTIYGA